MSTLFKLAPYVIIVSLVLSVAFLWERSQRLNVELSEQKARHKLQLIGIEAENAKIMNEEYAKMNDTLKEQQEKVKDIKSKVITKIKIVEKIVEKAKEDNDCSNAWHNANDDWGLPTKD